MENENIKTGTRVEILVGKRKGLSATILEKQNDGFNYLVNVYGELAFYEENEIKKI